jgi:quercetin dioxygenase-like cupin family protein
MEVFRNGSRPSVYPPKNFTGRVRMDPIHSPPPPAHAWSAVVTFDPGARTYWHTHPLGQTLLVISGVGWTQCEGGEIVEIHPGDVVYCPPGHKHWHGASATNAMTHVAITEALDGKPIDWLEEVSDEQYNIGPAKA